MDGQHILDFGTYKGKSVKDVSRISPLYLLWLAGVTTKYSLKSKSQELYSEICKEHPDEVKAIKDFVQGRCHQCWAVVSEVEKSNHHCKEMKPASNYHYHPYGKRS